MKHVEDSLVKNLETFVAFTRKRVGNPHLAEDVVQDTAGIAVGSVIGLEAINVCRPDLWCIHEPGSVTRSCFGFHAF